MEVHDLELAPEGFRTVHWELLEDPQLYADDGLFSSITVSRVVISGSTPSAHGRSNSAANNPVAEENPRLLAVTARKSHERDNPHRLVTLPLLKVLKKLKKSEGFEILRPPTFQHLSGRLTEKRQGYYKILHLDVHGSVGKDG